VRDGQLQPKLISFIGRFSAELRAIQMSDVGASEGHADVAAAAAGSPAANEPAMISEFARHVPFAPLSLDFLEVLIFARFRQCSTLLRHVVACCTVSVTAADRQSHQAH
jgi:hypothetical protein